MEQQTDPELEAWILDQVRAGHPPEAVVEPMLARGWQEQAAIDAVESVLRKHLEDHARQSDLPAPVAVPAPVLTKEKLVLMDKNALIIDLASEPCGTDFAAAEELGITAKKALGLPGKFAPKTAGEILKETVLNVLSEKEDFDA